MFAESEEDVQRHARPSQPLEFEHGAAGRAADYGAEH